MVRFTTNTEEIQNRLTFTQAKGRTALLDGVYMAMNQMKKARNPRKAIIILSDGGDNCSRYTESEIKNLVREADVQVFAIGIFEPMAGAARTAEELAGPGLLNDMAEATGGRHFPVENLNELPDVAAKIGMELRNQYVLGYSPTNTVRDGKYRKVQVKVKQPEDLPPLERFIGLGITLPRSRILPLACTLWRLWRSRLCLRAGHRRSRRTRPLSAPTRGWSSCTRALWTRTAACSLTCRGQRSRFTKTTSSSRIKTFRREDVPVSLGLVIDNSGSMRDKRKQRGVGRAGGSQSLESADEVSVINFNDEALRRHRRLHAQYQEDGRRADAARFARRHCHARRASTRLSTSSRRRASTTRK